MKMPTSRLYRSLCCFACLAIGTCMVAGCSSDDPSDPPVTMPGNPSTSSGQAGSEQPGTSTLVPGGKKIAPSEESANVETKSKPSR